MSTGTVKFCNSRRYFEFAEPDGCAKHVFVHVEEFAKTDPTLTRTFSHDA